MKSCITCGMPLEGEHEGEIGMETPEGFVCVHDCEDGKIKSPEEIFRGGVRFFLTGGADGEHELAERVTRRNMKSLAYWQAHPLELLDGEEATDEEFQDAMMKL